MQFRNQGTYKGYDRYGLDLYRFYGSGMVQQTGFGDQNGAGNPNAQVEQLRQALYAGHLDEAEQIAKQLLAMVRSRFGEDHANTYIMLTSLAAVYTAQARYPKAEEIMSRALPGLERTVGPEQPATLSARGNLAFLYANSGRYREAEVLAQRANSTSERRFGPRHEITLRSLLTLAQVYAAQGRFREAEIHAKQAVANAEHLQGRNRALILSSLTTLALIYDAEGRFAESEPIHKRALAGAEHILGKDKFETNSIVHGLAFHYFLQGRFQDSELYMTRAAAGLERVVGNEHYITLRARQNLARIYDRLGRFAEAEPLHLQTLAASERQLGKEHPATLMLVHNLGEHYQKLGRYTEAREMFQRAVVGLERLLGKGNLLTIDSLGGIAAAYFAQGDAAHAVEYWRRSTAAAILQTQRGAGNVGQALTGNARSETERSSSQFQGLVKAAYRLASESWWSDSGPTHEMFQMAQWGLRSEAAQSVAQMAARGAAGNSQLAPLVRERQDLLAEWQRREEVHNRALAQPPGERDRRSDDENKAQLAVLEARIAGIHQQLTTSFPEYASLANPIPLSVEEVQKELTADEALVFFYDTAEVGPVPEETIIWVVTKGNLRWVRSKLGTAALTREVHALRCGLDTAAAMGADCAKLTGRVYTRNDADAGKPLIFDHAGAYKLYAELFGQIQDLIKGKHLLIVSSGPLAQLPFQVLITAPPAGGNHRAAAWMVRSHGITVLPAVSSLKALRRFARPSAATKPLIGFGNPLLDGSQSDPTDLTRAQLARDSQSCDRPMVQRVARTLGVNRGAPPPETHGAAAIAAEVRSWSALPETAVELCTVARDLKVDQTELRLGAQATERNVKTLSTSGQLAQYRIIHFATHGALAKEVKSSKEPGLLLTPPISGSEEDDGYLTASEIVSLKLDADWVVLSACNTAGGNATGAPALSGLARAFIYAQARALLVSHWSVDSAATVKLITGAMREMATDAKTGRAEALRRSMLALIDNGEAKEAHPAFWAPFIVVGEGAR